MANDDLELKLKIVVDNQNAELELKKSTESVNDLENATEKANKTTFSGWVESVNDAVQSTKQLAQATKGFLANEVGITDAKESLKSFAVNVGENFLKLKQAFSQEASFSAASRTIEGTDEQLKSLNNTINDLSSTKIAVPVEDLYNVAGVAGAMGKAVQDIPKFIQTVSEGVVGLNIPAEQLAEKLGTIQTQLGLTENGLVSLSDQVNSVADTLPGKVKEIDIFEVLSKGVATAGKNFGLAKGEIIALTGSLLSLGEAPETARTGLDNLLSSLQNAKNQTPEFQDGLAAMGTSADKLAEDIKTKPMPTLLNLLETMNGMSKAARLDIATKLLGKGQDSTALAKLVDNTNLLKQALKTATDETEYSGSVHEAFAKQVETASAKTTILWNAVKNLGAALANPFMPVVKLAIDGLTRLVNTFKNIGDSFPVVRTITQVAATILSLGGTLRLFSFALSAIGLLSPAVTARIIALGASFLTLGSSVTMATTSLIEFIRTGSALQVVRTALTMLFGGTIGLAIGAIALLAVGITNLLPVTTKLGKETATVGEIIAAAWDVVMQTFQPMVDIVSNLVDSFNEFLKASLEVADVGELITLYYKGLANIFLQLASALNFTVTTIADSWGAIATEMSAGVQLVEDILSGNGVQNALQQFTDTTTANMKTFADSVNKGFEDAFKGNALDKFMVKTEEALKRKRAAKQLDEKDTRPSDTGTDISSQDPKAAADKEKQITQELDNELKNRNERVKTALEQRKQAIELMAISQIEKEKLITQATQAANDAQLLILRQNAQQRLAIIDERVNQKNAKAQNGGVADKAVIQQSYQDRIAVYRDVEKGYGDMIGKMVADEIRLKNESKKLADDRRNNEQSYEDFKRGLHQNGMTSEQKNNEDITRLQRLASDQKRALKRGDYEEANRLDNQILELGKKLAQSETELVNKHKAANQAFLNAPDQVGFLSAKADASKTYFGQVDEILRITDAAQKRVLDNNTKAQESNKQQLDSTKKGAAEAEKGLAAVQEKIANLQQELQSTQANLTVNADTRAVDDAIARITKPTESTHTINVVEQQKRASGGFIQRHFAKGGKISGAGTGTSDSIPAMLSHGEFVIKADSVGKVGVDNLNYINSLGRLPPIRFFSDGGFTGVSPNLPSISTAKTATPTATGEVLQLDLGLPSGTRGMAMMTRQNNQAFLNEFADLLVMQQRSAT